MQCPLQVDARNPGGLLLELYSQDGMGTMISTDFYEGIRQAGVHVSWRICCFIFLSNSLPL
jgi:hypothetical protein